MNKGDKCWIIENGFKVTSAEIVSASGNLVFDKNGERKSVKVA